MDKLGSGLIIVAAVIGIIAGATYISKSYRVDCVDWWPFNKQTCAVTRQ